MSVDDVMRRVEDDLARGHTFVAIQRLTTLVQANPKELAVRLRLAQVHLSTGNFVQAGRWFYLTDVRDERAAAAFEKAYRDPRAREDALCWALDADRDPHHVKELLTELHREIDLVAKSQKGSPLIRVVRSGVHWTPVLVTLACVGFFILGVVTFIRWVWPG